MTEWTLFGIGLEDVPAWASHMLFGALGGLLYILRQKVKRYRVRPIEYVARPIFGAVAAWVITIALGFPNHLTSTVLGYFGIDAWDAIASRFEKGLPFAVKHVPRDALGQAIEQRVEVLEEASFRAPQPKDGEEPPEGALAGTHRDRE